MVVKPNPAFNRDYGALLGLKGNRLVTPDKLIQANLPTWILIDGKGRIVISAKLGVMDDDPAFAAPQGPLTTVIVDVADDGPGVPPELTDRIFNPFFTTKPQGSGLGLPIVRKIVDAHDGRIDLYSSSSGTRFRVTLPVSTAGSWFK